MESRKLSAAKAAALVSVQPAKASAKAKAAKAASPVVRTTDKQRRKTSAKANGAAVVVTMPNVPKRKVHPLTPLQRADMVKVLVHPQTDAAMRIKLLSSCTLGDVAAICGLLGKAIASVYEVLAVKIAGLHGNDWVALSRALPSDLSDADKTRRKAIIATLEGIRETVKSNSAGNAAKAKETIRSVKEWGEGKRKARQPKGNSKQALKAFLKSWPALPSIYRRILRAEDADDDDMALSDAMTAWFKKRGINPRHVLEVSGKAAWNK